MTLDPLTDRIAAEAFTDKHAHRPARQRGEPERSKLINFHSPNKGKPQCQGYTTEIGSNYTWRHQCSAQGKTTLADGTTWCRRHDPAAVNKREAKSAAALAAHRAKWSAQDQAARERAAMLSAFRVFLVALQKIEAGANDAREVAREALTSYDPS